MVFITHTLRNGVFWMEGLRIGSHLECPFLENRRSVGVEETERIEPIRYFVLSTGAGLREFERFVKRLIIARQFF